MNNKMNNKKKVTLFLVAILMPLIYHGLNKLWYYVWLNLDLIDFLPTTVRTYLLTNHMSLDAIFCGILIVLILPYFLWRRKELIKNTPKKYIKPMNTKSFLLSVIITLGLGGISFLWQLFVRQFLMNMKTVVNNVQDFDNIFASATTKHAYLWMFLSIALLGPIIEELIFRGILFTELNRYVSGITAVVISSIYFGLWHSNLVQVVYTAILGLGIGLVYAATRNMWFPMLIHLINNMLSTLPPSLENNEIFLLGILILKTVAIIPMIIIIYKMIKNNPAVKWKIN